MKATSKQVTDSEFKQVQSDRHTSLQHEYPDSPWYEEVWTEFWPYIHEPFLDIGARDGQFLLSLAARGIHGTGLEVTDIADRSQAIVRGDIQKQTPFTDKQFASATMMHTLEHCYDPSAAVKEIQRIVSGHVLFIVPAQHEGQHEYAHFSWFEGHQDLADFLITHGYTIIKNYDKGPWVNVVIAHV